MEQTAGYHSDGLPRDRSEILGELLVAKQSVTSLLSDEGSTLSRGSRNASAIEDHFLADRETPRHKEYISEDDQRRPTRIRSKLPMDHGRAVPGLPLRGGPLQDPAARLRNTFR